MCILSAKGFITNGWMDHLDGCWASLSVLPPRQWLTPDVQHFSFGHESCFSVPGPVPESCPTFFAHILSIGYVHMFLGGEYSQWMIGSLGLSFRSWACSWVLFNIFSPHLEHWGIFICSLAGKMISNHSNMSLVLRNDEIKTKFLPPVHITPTIVYRTISWFVKSSSLCLWWIVIVPSPSFATFA